MLYKYIKYTTAWIIFLPLLTGLTACSEGKTLEAFFSPDPQLKSASETTETSRSNTQNNNSLSISPEESNTVTTPESTEPELAEEVDKSQEIENFPQTIPLYPQAELIELAEGSTETTGETLWRSPATIEEITSFYQEKFLENQWQVIQQTSTSESAGENVVIAIKDNLEVSLFLEPLGEEEENNAAATEFTLSYRPINDPLEETADTPEVTDPETSPENLESIAAIPFSDLDETPEQLRQYVKDVAALKILTPYEQDGKVDLSKFAPNEPVSRRDYARWLVNINNRFYASSSGKKIHLATKSDRPAFTDVSYTDPDYEVIQGLAEAGLIPSRLTNDSSKLLFQPDAPLTRENLLIWKVPLDLRKALPPASVEAISDSWGFQDANSIDPQGLRALFADFQNGDRANINRVFGYTTLFQPKKPVTRAEAAASLWYLGFQGEGINAKEAFKLQEENE